MKYSFTRFPLKLLCASLLMAALLFSGAIAQDEGVDKANQAKESFNTAIESVQKGDTATAISLYKGALELDNTLVDAHMNLGSIYFAQKKYKEAEGSFKAYTDAKPSDPIGFINLGKLYSVQKKITNAQAAYEGALAADENYAEAQKELGKLYYSAKKYDDCIGAMEKYTAKTDDYYALYLLGAAHGKKKSYNKAIESYKKALAVKANHFESLRNMGKIYSKKENFSKAVSYYKKALKAKPKDYKTAYNLAISVQSIDPEDYDACIAQWQKFLKLARKVPKAKKYIASTEELIKSLKEAKVVASEQ
ncbi:MAG: tetratricopeptide repeat protein [candidate division Zixibacteria bacterium]|nr:tetratricopeptide repeat protein [candidate division Zixibacteria bacterium]